uniref:Uncharacterized protein n=1 Tax=candidate division WOR-3 bacterium TaxID=2052148 RepID=A0A7C4YGG2_UNCW3
MSPVISFFVLINPLSLGIKGGLLFEKEGFFRPSFFIEERRIFTDNFISPLIINYDSVSLFTKSNSLGLSLRFFLKNIIFSLEPSYINIFQVYDVYRNYEFMKLSRVYEGWDFAFSIGKILSHNYLMIGIEFNSIFEDMNLKFEIGRVL